jgi:recombination protein RecT
MPTRASVAPLKDVKTIREALAHPELIERVKAALPRHLSPERMLRVFALSVQKTPKLAECDLWTLLGAMLSLASLGLEPNTPLGHAYLIPFEKRKKIDGEWVTEKVECNVVIGYRGYLDLMRRSGDMKAIHADVVYDGDEFSFEYGSNMHLRHVPTGSREGRKPLWAYAHVSLSDGQAFEVLPYPEVMRVRDNSEGYKSALRSRDNKGARGESAFLKNPWVAFEHEMAAKTMIRRMAKTVPMSIEFANAAALDSMSEAGRADLASIGHMQVVDLAALEAPTDTPVDFSPQQDQPKQEVAATAQAPAASPPAAGLPPHPAVQVAKAAEPTPTKAEAKQQPAQAEPQQPQPGTFDLIDEEGEYVDVKPTALEFAKWLVEKHAKSRDPSLLLENNQQQANEVMADPDGGEAAVLLQALYGGTAVVDAAIEMPMRNNKPHLVAYVEAYTAALAEAKSEADMDVVIKANAKTVEALPGGTRVAILRAVAARKQALGIPQAE